MKLILASKSPRRRELLKNAGIDFAVADANFDENTVDLSDPLSGVSEIARGKATAVYNALPENNKSDTVVLGADTIVVCDGKVLLKPKNEDDAFDMLKNLSGKEHQVYTAVSIVSEASENTFREKTDVEFYELSDEEIREYIKTGEPMDKAGAYGIQGKGGLFVRRINGDYYNVVGLPISRTVRELKKFIEY